MSAADGTTSQIIRLEQMVARVAGQKAELEALLASQKAELAQANEYLEDSIRLTTEVVRLTEELETSKFAGAEFQKLAVGAKDSAEYIVALQKRVDELADELADAKRQLATATADNIRLSNAVQNGDGDLRVQLNAAQNQLKRQTQAIAEAREQLNQASSEADIREETVIDLRSTLERTKKTHKQTDRELQGHIKKSVEAAAEIATLKKRLDDMAINTRETAKSIAEKTQLANAVDELTMNNARANAELQSLNDKYAVQAFEFAKLREEYEKSVGINATLTQKLAEATDISTRIANEKADADKRMNDFEQMLSGLSATFKK